jgi:hypothetical protein
MKKLIRFAGCSYREQIRNIPELRDAGRDWTHVAPVKLNASVSCYILLRLNLVR